MPDTATDRLQGLVTSVAVKPAVRVATTAAITLSGLQTIDGVTVAAGDRVLVKDQASAIDNGIYVANGSDWERALDFDGSLDAVGGTFLYVTSGTAGRNTYWRVAGNGTRTVGSDSIAFEAALFSDSASIQYEPEDVSVDEIISTLRFGSLGRGSPDPDFDQIPIRITGITPNGLAYDNDPASYAYANETNDGQFSEGVHLAPAPVGSDTNGDGSLEAPWETVDKAMRDSTVTNIHLHPAADGSTGFYEDWSMRYDVSPDGCAKLRMLISHGDIVFKPACDDISIDAVAKQTVGIIPGNVAVDGDTIEIGANTLTYKSSPVGALDIPLVPGDQRGEYSRRAIAVINANTDLLGVSAKLILPEVIEDPVIILIEANAPGSSGNSISLSVTSSTGIMTAGGSSLAGGGHGWTSEGSGVYSYQTTEGNPPPRAVLNHAVRDPYTGQPTPLTYYANVRRITFSGQPAVGDYFENTSGYLGATRRLTFVASGGGSYNEGTGQGSVNIGSTLAETIANFVSLINANALYFGLLADGTATVARLQVLLNSTPTIAATVSGANLSLSSQSDGKDELATFALNTGGNIPFASLSAGGWAFDEATLKLYVKLPGNIDVQTYKENLELVTGNPDTRCFVVGGRIGFLGSFQWRGTYLFATHPTDAEDAVTFPTRVWGSFTNPPDRPVGVCTPLGTGVFELSGIQSCIRGMWPVNYGAWGYCTTIDTYHLTDSAVSQVIEGGSELAGDPYTFAVTEFPNRNGISPHGADSVTAIFGGRYNRSVGPLIGGGGKLWMVGVEGNQSWGVGGNQFGLYGAPGATYWADSSSFAGSVDADVRFDEGTNYYYRLSYGSITGTGTPFIPPPPSA